MQRAREELQRGRPFDGLKLASQALQSDATESVEALLVHGQCQQLLGHYELALSDFAQVRDDAARASSQLTVWWVGAWVAARLGVLMERADGGEGRRRQVVERDNRVVEAFVGLGHCHFALGNSDAAEQQFDRALSLQPQVPDESGSNRGGHADVEN